MGETGELALSGLSGWIEGPGIFRRGNFSYLTYTGNHVISKGYRVGYSYAENLNGLSDFIMPDDNVTVIDTDDDHYGLGHSSNTVGPDLDSLYTAYHSLVGNGPARRYNVDRYFASGGLLAANGVTHRPVAMPDRADGYGYAEQLTADGGVYSVGRCNGYFTAEYNFVPHENQELAFGDGYRILFEEGKMRLINGKKAKAELLGEAEVSLPEGKLACVRVENGDGAGYVYVNGMRKISYRAQKTSGAVGYALREGVGFTAFSNEVFGTSDFEAFKNFPVRFPATSYLKGEMRGFRIAAAKQKAGGVRVGEKESVKRIGDSYALSLAKDDWVKYAVDVEKEENYLLAAEVSRASAGAELLITVGGETLKATLPQAPASEEGETVRVALGSVRVPAGVHAMKVQVTGGKADFVWFEAIRQEGGEVSLASFRAFGSAKTEDGALVVKNVGDTAGAAIFTQSALCDFEAEVTFQAKVEVGTDIGIMLRASHYSSFDPKRQPAQAWRGYYLQLGSSLLSLRKYDYGNCGALDSERLNGITFAGDAHTLVLRAEGNTFRAVLDGKVTLTAADANAFFGGGLGVYAGNGEIKILSLKYKKLSE